MSLNHGNETIANSGLGSSEETSKLLIEASTSNNNSAKMQKAQSFASSSNGPTTSSGIVTQQSLSSGSSNKPVLIRQDRTSTYLTSPQLSALGTSDDTSDDDNTKGISYQLMPNVSANRCRTCRSQERRSSVSPASVIYMPRSISKESVRERISTGNIVHQHSASIPPVFVTGSPTNSPRIIRQSSQPEASTVPCCIGQCSHTTPQTSSLRQLKEPSDGISGIAAQSLLVRRNI